MRDPINKLAQLLRTQPAVLLEMERQMDGLTGQEGVLEDILQQNDITVDRTLAGLGADRRDGPAAIRKTLTARMGSFDRSLYELLGKPDLTDHDAWQELCKTVLKVFTPPPGLFLKRERVVGLLEKYPPHNLLEHFGYSSIGELVEKEGFAPVMASLRFSQTTEWMHQFFDVAYNTLTPDDFEEREVELLVMPPKWQAVAEKFMQHKYHNVSHLKEFGVIFVIPERMDLPGETLRLFTLLLHYLHEVPFYAALFRRHLIAPEGFADKFRSLLRGDVPAEPILDHGKITWRIVQRYLAKDNADDFRLFQPHVNPEAEHWWHAEEDLSRLSRILGHDHGGLDLGWWTGLDFVGEVFTDSFTGNKELVSFDLIDQIMTLSKRGESVFLYHQQEALWNRIFTEYLGRDRLEELIQANIFKGFIEL